MHGHCYRYRYVFYRLGLFDAVQGFARDTMIDVDARFELMDVLDAYGKGKYYLFLCWLYGI